MEKDDPTFPGGPAFPNCVFLFKPIEFVIFQGAGVRTSGSARGIVNWVRPHIVLAKRHNNTLTPLMQVLCDWGKQRQGPTVLVMGIKKFHELGSAPCSKGVLCNGILYYSQRRT